MTPYRDWTIRVFNRNGFAWRDVTREMFREERYGGVEPAFCFPVGGTAKVRHGHVEWDQFGTPKIRHQFVRVFS